MIASSPTDLQPVMEAVAENAARVCGATDSSIFRLEGEHLRLVARHGSLRRTLVIGDTVPVRSRTPWPDGLWATGGRSTSRTSWRPRRSSRTTVSRIRRAGSTPGQCWRHRCCARARRWASSSSSGARGPSLLGQADRAPRDVRQPGGDRHRERPPVQRAAGADGRADAIGGAAHGAGRGRPCRQLDAGRRGGARHDRLARQPARRRGRVLDLRVRRGIRAVSPPRDLQSGPGVRGGDSGGAPPEG